MDLNAWLAHSRPDWLKLAVLALLYALMAKVSFIFAAMVGTIALLWLPSGMALAALLLGGAKYWPAIFIGASVVVYANGQSPAAALLMGAGNTLEGLFGWWLLRRHGEFDCRVAHPRNFFQLLQAALLAPLPAALAGTAALAGFGALASQNFGSGMLFWWMGDMFSILLITPLILVWRHRPALPLDRLKWLELLALLTLTLVFGQIIFFDWSPAANGPLASAFLMFVFVVWSAMRFGRHITLLVLCAALAQAVLSVLAGTGFFANDGLQTGLVRVWIYFVLLVAIGMILASSTEERELDRQELESSRARFIAFMNNMPGMAYIKDAQRRYIFVNKIFGAEGTLKLAPSAFLGKTLEQLDPNQSSPEMVARVRADDEAVLQLREVSNQEVMIGPLFGEGTLLTVKFPIVDSAGEVLIGGVTFDISERKRAEARIARLTQIYKALSEVNQGIVRLSDAADLFPLVCRVAVDHGGFKMAWIGQFEPASERIVAIASHGHEQDYLDGLVISARADVPEGRGQIGTAYRESRTIVANNLQERDNMALWRERVRRHGFNSCASFPIVRNGLPFAVFSVYQQQSDAFDTEAVVLLEEMAADVSFALDNLDREQQRRDARDALRASEQHFRAFFERSMVGMATSNTDKRWLDVNTALCDMLGYTHDELVQLTWADVTHPSDVATNVFYFDKVMRGEIDDYSLDKRMLRKDGRIVHTHITPRCLRKEDGSVDYFVVLVQDVSDKKQSEELLWRQANFDTLTGLPNRRMCVDRLQQEIKKRHHSRLPLALLFIDLDRFKEVNDTLGHAQGDMLLVEAARRIQAAVSEADTVARLGGDEFMILLTELSDLSQAEAVAHDLLHQLSQAVTLGTEEVYVSASIGITLYPADADSAEQLMRNADQALYVAKNLGRNRFSYFTPALQQVAQLRQKLINDMRGALAGQQFQLYFQPIVELAGQRIVKAEALLRWHHPQRGLIYPVEFIPLAEETGLILEIGNWVFHEAARWASQWAQTYHHGIQISVNTSPIELSADSFDPGALLDHLRQLGLPGSSITIEITEGILLNVDQRIGEHLQQFHDAGLQIAIDDFGTGYSSLASLKKLDIDYLKIDQVFVRNLATDAYDMALSEAIIVMAHKLDLQVVAEGIETEQQCALLRAAGCDYGQGYLFSKPVPPQEFEALLAAQARPAAGAVLDAKPR
jgi:diguanylate cyclase (GGDEF)-like protein/PAS domain S-box-containing protein